MKQLRQLLALVVIAAFVCFNTRSVDLHVHAEHGDAGHHHGPAIHHHDASAHEPGTDLRVAAVDANDTVIPLQVLAASASSGNLPTVQCVESATSPQPTVNVVQGPPLDARAHGPPRFRADSLRAPPASQPL